MRAGPENALMLELDTERADSFIRDIDSMARAAYAWVRQQTFEQRFIGLPVSDAEESDLAAGFLAGLKLRLTLHDTDSMLLAYVYVLMTGQRAGALDKAQSLLNRKSVALASASGYLHGLRAARDLLDTEVHRESANRMDVAPPGQSISEH
jgi:hypothetical protein